jgi:ribonuclease HI
MISLLSTLGKALEKVISVRLTYWAEVCGLLPKEHFGGRPGRSCDDALLLRTDFIKEQWRKGNVVLALSLDVKGAFPSVNKDRLLEVLRRKGVPEEAVRWVESFMDDRTATLVHEGVSSDSHPFSFGLPQGSPLSPILYLFYNTDLITSLYSKYSEVTVWIDDCDILIWGKSVQSVCERANLLLAKALEWSHLASSEFEPTKSTACLYSRKRTLPPLDAICIGGVRIKEDNAPMVLGATIDSKLTFTAHVQRMASKGMGAIGAIAKIAKSTQGLSLEMTRRLVTACVFSRTDYASSLYFNAVGFGNHVSKLEKVQKAAAKIVSGGFRNASLTALQREALLMPVALRLEQKAHREAVRLASLPSYHPLYPRVQAARLKAPPKHNKSPLHHLFALPYFPPSTQVETIEPNPSPPWEHVAIEYSIAANREEGIAAHQNAREGAAPTDLFIYTDGSLKDGHAGAGVVLYNGEGEIGRRGFPLGQLQGVYKAELVGIREALTISEAYVSITSPLDDDSTPLSVTIFTDNQGAVKTACNTDRSSGQETRKEIRAAYQQLTTSYPSVSVRLQWVPGHEEGIEGSEAADEAAKSASAESRRSSKEAEESQNQPKSSQPATGDDPIDSSPSAGETKKGKGKVEDIVTHPATTSELITQGKSIIQAKWELLWENDASATGQQIQRLDPRPPSHYHLQLHKGLCRSHSSILTQLRTGRSHLNADRHKTKVHHSPLCDHCGGVESLAHYFMHCPQYAGQRFRLLRALKWTEIDMSRLLSDKNVLPHTLAYINESARFPRYYSKLS